jgi:hypothetical protein
MFGVSVPGIRAGTLHGADAGNKVPFGAIALKGPTAEMFRWKGQI